MFNIFMRLMLFFVDKLSADGFYGNILAILSGVTSAVMMVSFRTQKDGAPAESILIASVVTAVLGFPLVLGGVILSAIGSARAAKESET
jgi:uncharacterized protein YcsI (UPF0317 family)